MKFVGCELVSIGLWHAIVVYKEKETMTIGTHLIYILELWGFVY